MHALLLDRVRNVIRWFTFLLLKCNYNCMLVIRCKTIFHLQTLVRIWSILLGSRPSSQTSESFRSTKVFNKTGFALIFLLTLYLGISPYGLKLLSDAIIRNGAPRLECLKTEISFSFRVRVILSFVALSLLGIANSNQVSVVRDLLQSASHLQSIDITNVESEMGSSSSFLVECYNSSTSSSRKLQFVRRGCE